MRKKKTTFRFTFAMKYTLSLNNDKTFFKKNSLKTVETIKYQGFINLR